MMGLISSTRKTHFPIIVLILEFIKTIMQANLVAITIRAMQNCKEFGVILICSKLIIGSF